MARPHLLDSNRKGLLVDALENLGLEPRAYSGRCMYGRSCLGVVDSNAAALIVALAIELLNEADDARLVADLLSELTEPQVDSMGRDQIVYWPSVAWEEEEPGQLEADEP